MSTAAKHSLDLPSSPASARAAAMDRPASAAAVPWYIWTGVAAVTSSYIGGAWDVAWHRSIGRDSFWTPAHMMIYLCGLLAAVVGVWFVAKCTFGRDPALRAVSVSILGLRAPFGVFLAGWGGLAMMTSAPFDNWWHNAYGLDVKIVSPPHTLLILGVRAVSLGMLFLILAAMNRAADAGEQGYRPLRVLFLYVGGLAIGGQMFFLQEFTQDIRLHGALAYIAMGIALPFFFATFVQASRFRWAATVTAAVYMLFTIGEILILPLASAEPRLGPVYQQVTHLVPAKFPILIVVPALALDLLWQRVSIKPGGWKQWQVALVSGVVFVAVLAAVEWPFADFLMSHASENRFFGTIYSSYSASPLSLDRLRRFAAPEHGLALTLGLARAGLYAAISTWLGLSFGRWMRTVQR